MTPETVMTLGFQAIKVGLMLATPLLLTALVSGLLVSLLQACTQINEATLSFIPKMLMLVVVMVVLGPWMLSLLLDYMHNIFTSIPQQVK